MFDDPFPSSLLPGADVAYVLRLYVAGSTPLSGRAITNIKAICEAHLQNRYTLTVVDLYAQRDRAQQDEIFVVPTLVRRSPAPERRLIGDLSHTADVLKALDLPLAPPTA